MRHLITRSGFWLATLALLLAVILWFSGRLSPTQMPDTRSYLEYDTSTLSAALSDVRTFGYPLFLRAVGTMELVPVAQYFAMVLSVLLFYGGLRRVGYRRWTALCCAATLLPGRAVFDLGHVVTSDSLAISLSVACTGAFLMITSDRPGPMAWIAFTSLTFLACQVHPSYLFLVPMWPIVSLVLDRYLLRRDDTLQTHARRAFTIAMASATPFLAFCTLRWFVVGHWGLVSFGGYNIVGIAGQFLDEELLAELPADLQPLGQQMLENRRSHDDVATTTDFATMEAMYPATVWQIAVPAAEEVTDSSPTSVNRILTRFSLTVIQHRPKRYALWLAADSNHARRQLTTLTAFDKGTLCLGIAYLLIQTVSLVRGTPNPEPGRDSDTDASRRRERLVLFWIAVFHAVGKTGLVILVEPANDRYMTGAMVLLPAVIAVWVAHAADDTFPRTVARFNRS